MFTVHVGQAGTNRKMPPILRPCLWPLPEMIVFIQALVLTNGPDVADTTGPTIDDVLMFTTVLIYSSFYFSQFSSWFCKTNISWYLEIYPCEYVIIICPYCIIVFLQFPKTPLELNGVLNSSKKQSLFHHDFLVPARALGLVSLLFFSFFCPEREGFCSIKNCWLLLVPDRVPVLVPLVFCSVLSFLRKVVLFHHYFLVFPGTGFGAGACLPSPFFLFLWKGATNELSDWHDFRNMLFGAKLLASFSTQTATMIWWKSMLLLHFPIFSIDSWSIDLRF